MKMFDSVLIVCDQGAYDVALAVRSALELFRLNVYLHVCIQKRNVQDVFSGNVPETDYVVFCCHGLGSTNGFWPGEDPKTMEMGFNVVDEDNDWAGAKFTLTPANIKSLVNLPGRTIVALGCGSGREPFARAFLDSGCKAYIGPDGPPDQDSAALFAITFFYYLLSSERDSSLMMTDEKAVERAASVDTKTQEGTHLFRYYSRETVTIK